MIPFAYRHHHLDRFMDPKDVLTDKGYQGLNLITLTRKSPGRGANQRRQVVQVSNQPSQSGGRTCDHPVKR